MDWQDKYLCAIIEREKISWKKMNKVFTDFFVLFKHAISFHEYPKRPIEELPDFITEDDDFILIICKEFYDDANNRIDKIEEKAIKLLPYTSALFAFISFAFINTSLIFSKALFLAALIVLILSILISFRCVNIKSRETIFLPCIYDFSKEPPVDNFKKKKVAKSYLNASIFNQNIADNSTDILKASRHMLIIALIISMLGFIVGIGGYFNEKDNVYIVEIDKDNDLLEIREVIENTNKLLNEINININKDNDLTIVNGQIDKLSKEIELIESKYNELLIKVTEDSEQIDDSLN